MSDPPSTLPPALLAKLKKRGIVKAAVEEEEDKEADLPLNWRVVVEKGSDSKYYWNTVTGATVWDRPIAVTDGPDALDAADTAASLAASTSADPTRDALMAAAVLGAKQDPGSIGPSLMKKAYDAMIAAEVADDVPDEHDADSATPVPSGLGVVDALQASEVATAAAVVEDSGAAGDQPIRYDTCWKCGKKKNVLPDGICVQCAHAVSKRAAKATLPRPPPQAGVQHLGAHPGAPVGGFPSVVHAPQPPPMLAASGHPGAHAHVHKRQRMDGHPRPPMPPPGMRGHGMGGPSGPAPAFGHSGHVGPMRPPFPQHFAQQPPPPPHGQHFNMGMPPQTHPQHHTMPHHMVRAPPPQHPPPRHPPPQHHQYAHPPQHHTQHGPPMPGSMPARPPPHATSSAPRAQRARPHRPPPTQADGFDPMDPSAYSDTPVGNWGRGLAQSTDPATNM
eukprot:m.81578 g.81578  ORF g.81578 m.81578 type:complete len:447 (-) comp19480_c0_seq1:80-1420(-)